MSFGTKEFGQEIHIRIAQWCDNNLKNVNVKWSVQPGQTGIDGEVIGGDPGFKYIEIKPQSDSGLKTFMRQLNRWAYDKEDVLALFYDKDGNIYTQR
jgi:hypothetical protein